MNGESTATKRFHKPYHFLTRLEKQGIHCLSEVFKNFHLDDFRRELKLWLHIALSNNQSAYDEGNTREDLIDFIEELHKLIEALYVRHKKYNHSKKSILGKGLSKQMQRMLREMNIPVLLTDEEMRKPALAIKAFCKTFPSGCLLRGCWICWMLLLHSMAIKKCIMVTWYYFTSTYIA